MIDVSAIRASKACVTSCTAKKIILGGLADEGAKKGTQKVAEKALGVEAAKKVGRVLGTAIKAKDAVTILPTLEQCAVQCGGGWTKEKLQQLIEGH